MMRFLILFLLQLNCWAFAADPFEIQVYTDDISKPGETGLEIHTNYIPTGHTAPSGPTGLSDNHTWHTALEFSHGITEDFDIGLYYQTLFKNDQGYYAGTKLRAKYLPKHEGKGYWGINMEVARTPTLLDNVEWATELRPIFGINGTVWRIAFNPILDWILGQGVSVPEFEPCLKFGYHTEKKWTFGIEYYTSLGEIDKIPKSSDQEHTLYLVFDNEFSKGELNVGIGRGLTPVTNDWVIKTIVGMEL